jgi:hypothetical protein
VYFLLPLGVVSKLVFDPLWVDFGTVWKTGI